MGYAFFYINNFGYGNISDPENTWAGPPYRLYSPTDAAHQPGQSVTTFGQGAVSGWEVSVYGAVPIYSYQTFNGVQRLLFSRYDAPAILLVTWPSSAVPLFGPRAYSIALESVSAGQQGGPVYDIHNNPIDWAVNGVQWLDSSTSSITLYPDGTATGPAPFPPNLPPLPTTPPPSPPPPTPPPPPTGGGGSTPPPAPSGPPNITVTCSFPGAPF